MRYTCKNLTADMDSAWANLPYTTKKSLGIKRQYPVGTLNKSNLLAVVRCLNSDLRYFDLCEKQFTYYVLAFLLGFVIYYDNRTVGQILTANKFNAILETYEYTRI